MTLDASGNLVVGATSNGVAKIYTFTTSGGVDNYRMADENSTVASGIRAVGDAIAFRTQVTERARIDSSGNLLIGTTSSNPSGATGGSAFLVLSDDRRLLRLTTSTASARDLAQFYNSNGQVGAISTSGSSTTYATSSDYRLKNTIAPMTGALARVAALKPCTYKWNADGSDGEGFIAHELAEVVPQCVTGEKDAVDAEGKPQYQGIDTSFLVATLTAAIQEQQALIQTLTARVAALESN